MVSASESVRVVRVGNIRIDYRVEKLLKALLDMSDAVDIKSWKHLRHNCQEMAVAMGWFKGNDGKWRRE